MTNQMAQVWCLFKFTEKYKQKQKNHGKLFEALREEDKDVLETLTEFLIEWKG